MKSCYFGFLVVGIALTAFARPAAADDAKDEAIKKDRKQIEGRWTAIALEINGNKSSEADAKKITVINGPDGAWQLHSEGREISKGTCSLDPTQKPKTIDFTPTEGEGAGQQYLGIYELDENRRRLCFAPPGKQRPTEFASTPGSELILVTYERVKAR